MAQGRNTPRIGGGAGGLAFAALALLLAGCPAAPLRLELKEPPPPSPGVLEDADIAASFEGTTRGIAVTLRNKSAEPMFVYWDKARFATPSGEELPVIALRAMSKEELDAGPKPEKLEPGTYLEATVHPVPSLYWRREKRELILRPSVDEAEAAGKSVRLKLPVDIGRRPAYYELRFELVPEA